MGVIYTSYCGGLIDHPFKHRVDQAYDLLLYAVAAFDMHMIHGFILQLAA